MVRGREAIYFFFFFVLGGWGVPEIFSNPAMALSRPCCVTITSQTEELELLSFKKSKSVLPHTCQLDKTLCDCISSLKSRFLSHETFKSPRHQVTSLIPNPVEFFNLGHFLKKRDFCEIGKSPFDCFSSLKSRFLSHKILKSSP